MDPADRPELRAVAPRPDDGGLRAGPALRWTRAALLAGIALGSGVVAHVSAQGRLPGLLVLLALYAAATAAAAGLLGRPASTRRVVLLVVAGQTLTHGFLTALSGHRGDPPLQRAAPVAPLPVPRATPSGTSRRGSYYELAYSGPRPGAHDAPMVLPDPVQHLLADLTGPHAAMAIAHLLAAGVVGLWLASGERALWNLLTLLVDGVRCAVAAWADALAGPAVLARATDRLRASARAAVGLHRDLPAPGRVLARVVQRRGPPLAVLAG